MVDKNIMEMILKTEKILHDDFKLDINTVEIASAMRLYMNTSENWQIYIDLSGDADVQLSKLNLLLAGGMSSQSRKNLRYIDLRPKDRAIICDNSTCGG